ncbi:helix-turn-helix transcriptional regulator [Streptomyces canus]|uniref:helix-turn-helix transcriptional regulator n=1 Tax=Streptomyces canus TaxID=58343 RepID=UPI002DDC8382|nr:LuxR C-terminal-related transcriptional regulator [Streptomyces canus]WSD82976.1 LuxR C-terminal-related transcriptional regulator [Streptomyces canus]WSD91857.1 LuxR C-terminal-related transcriptional regulator [Streptomyces canus]WSD92652.1 LuxR C-terminal-related transcriptional regulator [Streptomyces canus]
MPQANLQFLNVEPDDEETYRLLLRLGGFKETELARQVSNDPPHEDAAPDPRAIHRRLTELGLATETPGGLLAPVSPAKAVEGLVERTVGRLRHKLEEEVIRSGIVDSLLAEHEKSMTSDAGPATSTSTGQTQHIEGMAAVRTVIDELTFFTRTENLTTSPTGILSQESIAHARLMDSRILRRGVHMRTILASPALDDPTTMTYLRELTFKGANVRISYDPIERLIICDRAAALTPIDPAHTSKGAILTRDPGLVAALVSLFERMWQTAHDLPTSDDGEVEKADFASDFERQVLRSLYTAEKDEIGARDLGIAVRTYRKHVASLMQRLGATNRFQAALLAHERGWI